MERDTDSGEESVFDGDLGKLREHWTAWCWAGCTFTSTPAGWCGNQSAGGGFLENRSRTYEIEEWISVGAGRIPYNRDQSGPASAFDDAHRGEYALLTSQLKTEQAPSDPLDEVTVALKWLRGEERLHKLAELDSWQPDPPAPSASNPARWPVGLRAACSLGWATQMGQRRRPRRRRQRPRVSAAPRVREGTAAGWRCHSIRVPQADRASDDAGDAEVYAAEPRRCHRKALNQRLERDPGSRPETRRAAESPRPMTQQPTPGCGAMGSPDAAARMQPPCEEPRGRPHGP